MTDNQAYTRQFVVLSQAWYGNSIPKKPYVTDEITLGLYDNERTTQGELTIRWYNLDSRALPSARLESFFDSWAVLAEFKDVIDKLAGLGEYPSVQQVAELLISCGFEDATPRVRPNN